MSTQIHEISDELIDYINQWGVREPPLLKRLREETGRGRHAGMQIAPVQGAFMALLLQLTSARRCIEVGVFTGYSSLCCALALPEDGYILACDRNREWTRVARRYWREAGIEHKIDLRLGPAMSTLDRTLEDGQAGQFDSAFIDADKSNQIDYFERCLQLLRPGGVIMVDNVLWSGAVVDPKDCSESTSAIRAFNRHVAQDERVDLSLVPIGDGLTLCRKR